jgi:hypothetical protein
MLLYAERLDSGGLGDSPGARAEVLRFDASFRDELTAKLARQCDYQTYADDLGTQASSKRPEPAEEAPLVGSTPHYEWP